MFQDSGQKKIEIPPEVKAAGNEPQVFSMPEKFRGLAAKVSPPVMKPVTPIIPATPVPPPKPVLPPIPVLTKGGLVKKKGMSKMNLAILIAGLVLLVVLGGAGAYLYFVFQPVKTTTVSNTNIPTNTNKPTNQVNTPANTGSNQITNQATTPISPFPNNSQPGRDTDSDGLTDAEEILYKTSSKKPDTDSDGFLDGNEVFHGYDPNSPDPARLNDSDIVSSFEKATIYKVLYPKAWVIREGTDENVTFVVPSGETVIISLESKEAGVLLSEWFSGTNPSSEINVTESKTKRGYSALVTEDQMTVYIEAENRVIVMSYQNTVKASVDYLATFEMMINSLELVQ